jgi:hypothetical protein
MAVTARRTTAPAYYLGRPASVWINALTRRRCTREIPRADPRCSSTVWADS